MHWAKFDDLRARVGPDDQARPVSEQTGNTFDFMLIYERMAAEEEDVAVKDVQEEDNPAVTSDTAEKTISISSGAEETSDEQVSVADSTDEEVSDEGETSDEDEVSDEEDLHIDYGYGPDPADPELLAAQTARYLRTSDVDSSDKDSSCEDSVDEDSSLEASSDDETDCETLPEEEGAADDNLGRDFVDSTSQAQAQEIAALYQQTAELVAGDVKEELLVKAQQVLKADSVMPKLPRKQEQEDNRELSAASSNEEMPDQPTDESQTSESENMPHTSEDMPTYAKDTQFANGHGILALFLGGLHDVDHVDHVDIIRRLLRYTGNAIMLCKRLHWATDAAPDGDSDLFERTVLGSDYRKLGKYLLDMNITDNMAENCQMYVCGSYVMEMSRQLGGLQAAQIQREKTAAALEAQNNTLQTHNNTLKAQNDNLEPRNDALQVQVDQLQAQL
jgi:hypothetical protein